MSSNPATGSVGKLSPPPLRVVKFHISERCDKREIKELFEVLEARGADYGYGSHLSERGWYELRIPQEFDWQPYYQALQLCNSVDQVSDYIEFCGRSFRATPL